MPAGFVAPVLCPLDAVVPPRLPSCHGVGRRGVCERQRTHVVCGAGVVLACTLQGAAPACASTRLEECRGQQVGGDGGGFTLLPCIPAPAGQGESFVVLVMGRALVLSSSLLERSTKTLCCHLSASWVLLLLSPHALCLEGRHPLLLPSLAEPLPWWPRAGHPVLTHALTQLWISLLSFFFSFFSIVAFKSLCM